MCVEMTHHSNISLERFWSKRIKQVTVPFANKR